MTKAGRATAPAVKGDDPHGKKDHHQHGSETPV